MVLSYNPLIRFALDCEKCKDNHSIYISKRGIALMDGLINGNFVVLAKYLNISFR